MENFGNIDLTDKQIERLKEETKHLSAFIPNGEGYCPKYPESRNGFYYHIIRHREICDSTIKTIRRIARRTRTKYYIVLNNDRLELQFYATFDKLPKTLI